MKIMFKNPLNILITVGVLAAIAIALQFVKTQETEVSETIKAIPEDAVIVLETNNYYSLIKNFNGNNQFRQEFSELEQLKGFFNESDYIDSLIAANSEFQNIIDGNKIMISGHMTANNNIEFIYVIPIKDKSAIESVNKTIASIVSNDATIRQRLYEGYTINDVVFFRDESKIMGFSYAFADGLFVLSISRIQTEAALRRLKSDFSLAKDPSFRKLMVSSGKNVDANIYLNYRYLPNLFKNVLKSGNGVFYEFISSFASWTELDVKMKNDAFLLSGFTFADDSSGNYLNVLKSQSSLSNEFLEAMPGNTASFIAFNLSDGMTWKEDYSNYLHKQNESQRVTSELDKIDKKYEPVGKNKSKLFYHNIDGGVAVVWTNGSSEENQQDAYIIAQMRDVDATHNELQMMFKIDSLLKIPVVIDQSAGVKAYNFSQPKLFSLLFGKAFSGVDASWYIKYKGYLVFAESTKALQNYLRNVKSGQRLLDDKNFILYSNSISSESNLFLYSNISGSKDLISKEMNDKSFEIYNKNIEKFNKIEAVSLQFGSGSKLLATNLYIGFNPRAKKTGKNTWEVALDANTCIKPQFVKSHVTGNNQILVQDNANNLVLISEKGSVLWKKKLSGKILGEIHQIDLYKNNKYQFLFNTKEYLYMLDVNGKNVEDYPIKLKSPATNGMAVFDYDRDRTYRMLVACENRSVYLLNTNGSKVDGWEFGQTESEVSLPAQHFISDAKDYIVFGDKMNTYILSRRGETRVEVKSKFEKNPICQYYFEKGESEKDKCFIVTDKIGSIYFIFLDGSVKKMEIDDFSPEHQFLYADIDGDGKNQFIFADKNRLYVYNRDKSVKVEKKFDGNIANSINLYQISKKSKYIGVSPQGSNKLYLLNPNGENLKGFPIIGSGPFSIGKIGLNEKNNEFSLVSGSGDNYLFNYRLGIGAAE